MNKVYVITGGMGKTIARRFGHQGHLLLVDVNEERLIQTANELALEGITAVTTRKVDITNEQQVNELAAMTGEIGELGAIIHTAGLSPTLADPRRILEVNSVGTALILQAFLPLVTPDTVAANSAHSIRPRRRMHCGRRSWTGCRPSDLLPSAKRDTRGQVQATGGENR